MATPLQQFLIARKLELLAKEKRAMGAAQLAMAAQIQMTDAILIFLASQQTEEDMTKLRLTLDKQATPVDDIKPRQETEELAEALIELSFELEQQVKEKKFLPHEKKELKYPLNNLPPGTKPKSVTSKIYGLKKAGRLPANIFPTTRTEKDRETGKAKEVVYLRCKKGE